MSMWRAIVCSCSASVSMVTCRTVAPAAPLTATRWYTKDIFGHNSVDYHDHASRFKTALQTELSSPTRYQPLAERQTRSELPPEAQKAQYRGKYLTVYRGHQLLKTPSWSSTSRCSGTSSLVRLSSWVLSLAQPPSGWVTASACLALTARCIQWT